MVERNLAKVEVAGSSPVSRSSERLRRTSYGAFSSLPELCAPTTARAGQGGIRCARWDTGDPGVDNDGDAGTSADGSRDVAVADVPWPAPEISFVSRELHHAWPPLAAGAAVTSGFVPAVTASSSEGPVRK